MGIQPELNFFLIFRSLLESKCVHFYLMNEKYGYKNSYKIADITQYLGVVIKMPLSLKKRGGAVRTLGNKDFGVGDFFRK